MRIRDGAIVRRAVELGAEFLDTADVYGDGESDRLIGGAFDAWPDGVALGTKGGLHRGAARFRDGCPEYLRRALEASLQRLRRDHVELYTLHRHDPEVPIEESVGAIDELPAVQNEFNRGFLVSEPVLEECERAGISFMPWAPLGEGLRAPAEEIRWLLDRSPVTVPIPGTSSIEHLEQFWPS